MAPDWRLEQGAPLLAASALDILRRLAWPLAVSLAAHVGIFFGWHSPLLYASIGYPSGIVHARLAPAPQPIPDSRPPTEERVVETGPEPAAAEPDHAAAAPAIAPPETRFDPQAYLPAGAHEEPAAPLGDIDPDYPDDPALHALEGRVILLLLINERGAVDRVIVEDTGDLPSRFGESAAQAFLAARFRPARKSGVPVKSRVRIEVRFETAR